MGHKIIEMKNLMSNCRTMRDLITNLSSVELTIPEKMRVKVLDYVFDHVLDVTMDVRVAVVDALEISVK